MDIGNQKNNMTFYRGYEGEKEVIITANDCVIHIWDGYFSDIFGNPLMRNGKWSGFTRDYNESINSYGECVEWAIDPQEYLEDLMLYIKQDFDFNESRDVLELLINIMQNAIKNGIVVTAHTNQ